MGDNPSYYGNLAFVNIYYYYMVGEEIISCCIPYITTIGWAT